MNIQTKAAKHSAPGQYLGFALQPVRLFYHLLTCPQGAKVSLEYLDDVAVHYPDGSLCLEQTKSALKQNPISDWAADLWKAFDNWLAMLKAGECAAGSTRFRLYVAPVRKGDFASALAAASTAAEVAAAVETVRKKLSKLKAAPGCIGHLQPFLDAAADEQFAIVRHFELESDTADPVDSLRALLQPTVHESHVDLLCKAGIGLAKQAVDRLIQHGELPILDADSFRSTWGAFLRKNLMPGLLTSLGEAPDKELVAGIASSRPTFIRQLEFVEASEDDRLRAVSDFLRTSADKVDWAERGLIFSGSLDDWDDGLVQRHNLIRGDIADLHGDKPVKVQGRLAYRHCAGHQEPLEGRAVPGHFVHGSFNDLADRRRLGWHPDYEALLGGDET
jgi:hypothetical protein